MHLFNNSNWIQAKKCRSCIFVSATSRAGAGIPKCAPDYTLPPCPMLRAVGLIAAFFGQEPHLYAKTLVLFKHPSKIVSSPNIVKISSSVSRQLPAPRLSSGTGTVRGRAPVAGPRWRAEPPLYSTLRSFPNCGEIFTRKPGSGDRELMPSLTAFPASK